MKGSWKGAVVGRITKSVAIVVFGLAYSWMSTNGILSCEESDETLASHVRPTDSNEDIVADVEFSPETDEFRVYSSPASNDTVVRMDKVVDACWRWCLHRRNKIFYIDRGAGLKDRIFVIRLLSELAGYLCASLELPPPYELLHPMHNGGERVHEMVNWSDLYNLTFVQDFSPTVTARRDVGSWRLWTPYPAYNSKNYSDWFRVITLHQVYEDFERVQEFSWNQNGSSTRGFIWEIKAGLFSWDVWRRGFPHPPSSVHEFRPSMFPLHPELNSSRGWMHSMNGCSYVSDDGTARPRQVVTLEMLYTERVKLLSVNSTVVFLHIRRGDTIEICDTSLEKMREYLRCSFLGIDTNRVTLLVSTDERNRSYIDGLSDIVKDTGLQFLNAESVADRVLQEAADNGVINHQQVNNHLKFLVQQNALEYESVAQVKLKQRRSHCPSCYKLAKTAPQVFSLAA